MSNRTPTFDDIYMELAQNLARKSHCVKAQVGAVIAKDTRIVSLGYNGPPSGTHNCDKEWPGQGCERSMKGGCSLAPLGTFEGKVPQAALDLVAEREAAIKAGTFTVEIDDSEPTSS